MSCRVRADADRVLKETVVCLRRGSAAMSSEVEPGAGRGNEKLAGHSARAHFATGCGSMYGRDGFSVNRYG